MADRRWRRLVLIWLSVALVSLAGGGSDAASGAEVDSSRHSLTALTSNVRFGSANDGENRWDLRKDLLVETWREVDADVVGTQEMLPFQAEYLRDQLKVYDYIGQSREPHNADGEQCGIFVRRDRFVVLELGHFWLSESPSVPGTKSWDTSLPRMATWTKLFDRQSQSALLVLNTHFDHIGGEARRQSAALIRAFVAQRAESLPVIVLGDFNCGENSPPYQALLADREAESPLLADAYRKVHPTREASEGTFNGFQGKSDGERIDWVLVTREFQVESCEIVTNHREQRYPSDHFFVRARLTY